MCKMLFPKSGCDYLFFFFPQKKAPFLRVLESKEGAGACPSRVAGCWGSKYMIRKLNLSLDLLDGNISLGCE